MCDMAGVWRALLYLQVVSKYLSGSAGGPTVVLAGLSAIAGPWGAALTAPVPQQADRARF